MPLKSVPDFALEVSGNRGFCSAGEAHAKKKWHDASSPGSLIINEMMEQCCGSNGKPDFDMMKQYCGQEGMPNKKNMMELMEKCGCRPS